jgi:hypothetical protein
MEGQQEGIVMKQTPLLARTFDPQGVETQSRMIAGKKKKKKGDGRCSRKSQDTGCPGHGEEAVLAQAAHARLARNRQPIRPSRAWRGLL